MTQRLLLILPALLCFLLAQAQNFSEGFPFNLPPDDSSAQRFLPEFPAEPITDFVRVGPDGHFEAGGTPLRFWGVNLTTGACFPVPDKAPFIAARMRKMGVNLVRFHHMDNPWSGAAGSLFDPAQGTTRRLHPATLDRLHYFLAQLKRNGIYANLNLHVSRTFTEADGVLYADSIPEFGKAVTMFDGQLIELQKEYARQLLGAVNPHTGLALSQDPVVAMVEITNENTIYGYWREDGLRPFADGGRLLQRHADTLDQQWLEFLEGRYGDDAALAAAWQDEATGDPVNLIDDGDFESGSLGDRWQLEQHAPADGSVTVDDAFPFEGRYAARVSIDAVSDTDWHLQFKRTGLTLFRDSLYVLQFAARADRPRTASLSVIRDNSPWTWYVGRQLQLSTEWQTFTFTFSIPETNQGQVRVTFNLGREAGDVWFDHFRLGKPVVQGLDDGESLAGRSVRRIPYSERLLYHEQRVADLAAFYIDRQRRYYREMYDYLRDDLGVVVPITGSNALGGAAEIAGMADLDYYDDHAYWDHPRFPNQPWSPTDWLIDNRPMVQHERLGALPPIFGGLAVAGKPYTISEYNHGFPNRYEVEMMPLLTTYAALHDAGGLMFFEYNGGSPDDWESEFIDGFFALHRNSAQMALSPLAGYAFRQGLIRAAEPIVIDYSPDYLYREIPQRDNNGRWGKFFPYDPAIALVRPVRIGAFDTEAGPPGEAVPAPGGPPYRSITGEATFDPQRGLQLTATPRWISLTGFLDRAAGTVAGPLRLTSADGFGVLAWLALDGQPLAEPGRSVLALSARSQNTGMVWDGNTTVRNRWGQAPTTVQPLSAALRLALGADSLRLYPLDPRGKETGHRTFYPEAGGDFSIVLDQRADRTLWYGLEVFPRTTSTGTPAEAAPQPALYPIPAGEAIWLDFPILRSQAPVQFQLFNTAGQAMGALHTTTAPVRERIDLAGLPPGWYVLRVTTEQQVFTRAFIKR